MVCFDVLIVVGVVGLLFRLELVFGFCSGACL